MSSMALMMKLTQWIINKLAAYRRSLNANIKLVPGASEANITY